MLLKNKWLIFLPVFLMLYALSYAEETTTNKVVVYYFYGNVRCYSCKQIETLTKEAVESGFKEEIKKGRVKLQPINVEQAQNRHFIFDYQLTNRSVVVANFENDKQKNWKNLMKVWQLLKNETAFINYVQSEIKTCLKGKC